MPISAAVLSTYATQKQASLMIPETSIPGGTDVILQRSLSCITPAPNNGKAQAQARLSGIRKGGGAAEWTEGQKKLLLEYYYKYFPQIGPFKKFKNKKQAFKQISMDVEAILGIKKTPEQCENRYKTVIRRRKAASDNNNRSGASPSPVPFDDEIRKIETIDDSIEPEVQRDASGVIFKDSPESPSLVSPNAESIEKSESQSPNADVKPRSSTVRLQHMQLFFSEMKAINEERECRKAARDAEKENRRAQRQVERQALLDERRKMHNEKMEILRQAFGLQK
ncbi:hypothetical protein HPB49_001362 [Dermacentor silvarum]|uniref:Uncharacterized protein n=1 Tax=Dermacentor silvarum TaxID=543639 RepID=A0ACB8CCY5_DERSI|nr:hypothetical protein HPB49_001362 [Dermacentor silvarum]